MSGKRDRETRREERLREEAGVASDERRQKLIKVGSAAAFLVVVVVAVLIVVASSGGGSGGDASNLKEVAEVEQLLDGIPQHGLVLGEPGAKVTVLEFGDLQCPFCKGFSEEILPPVIQSQVASGEAKLSFNNFTIIGPESVPAGAAAIAAGKQGRGWNYVELFYRNQGEENSGYVTDEFLTAVAKGAGVPNIAKWNKDRKAKSTIEEVEATTAKAESLEFSGTPSFAVEGPGVAGVKKLGTPGSSGDLEAAIEDAAG
ncbi:MAG TPA: thioredoxin domain-containing protein [Solirubrobacterales bacterium]|nr:thioredoxin domain-containing protein [Solirubrobacterales bacterium]